MAKPHERLDQAMNERRIDLDMTWSNLAVQARIAPVTLRAIRKGNTGTSELTRRRLEDALGWAHGSIDATLAGGDPTPQADPASESASLEQQLMSLTRQVDELTRQVEELRRATERDDDSSNRHAG